MKKKLLVTLSVALILIAIPMTLASIFTNITNVSPIPISISIPILEPEYRKDFTLSQDNQELFSIDSIGVNCRVDDICSVTFSIADGKTINFYVFSDAQYNQWESEGNPENSTSIYQNLDVNNDTYSLNATSKGWYWFVFSNTENSTKYLSFELTKYVFYSGVSTMLFLPLENPLQTPLRNYFMFGTFLSSTAGITLFFTALFFSALWKPPEPESPPKP